ncbi:carbonic anhydrase 5B, mitochondrial-like isoform X1 [Neovison vison]|uniref:carbonic anhydrase 5B, mitochondrial-like isoform X1 n=1 Tax=Neovison vison TaxID=452646 RepID=UPI001CEFBFEC|nr:carbonic anhydrase 5B, mitochondrial-like isoform X1 [Neogale vison]XP_044091195.1 carbonic anhydrase 5B, mitochondrial-like isoform X1 [Neogale vison]
MGRNQNGRAHEFLLGTEWKGPRSGKRSGYPVPASHPGPGPDSRLNMVVMSSLRVVLQASPCKSLWRRFQTPRFVPARPCSLYTCTYKSRNRALHPLWETVDLVPGGERQSPINIRWRDSVYDPGLKPLTISYDPTTCLHVWNNGYSFLVEFEDSTDKSEEVKLPEVHCFCQVTQLTAGELMENQQTTLCARPLSSWRLQQVPASCKGWSCTP